jgi:hypothetical protein
MGPSAVSRRVLGAAIKFGTLCRGGHGAWGWCVGSRARWCDGAVFSTHPKRAQPTHGAARNSELDTERARGVCGAHNVTRCPHDRRGGVHRQQAPTDIPLARTTTRMALWVRGVGHGVEGAVPVAAGGGRSIVAGGVVVAGRRGFASRCVRGWGSSASCGTARGLDRAGCGCGRTLMAAERVVVRRAALCPSHSRSKVLRDGAKRCGRC